MVRMGLWAVMASLGAARFLSGDRIGVRGFCTRRSAASVALLAGPAVTGWAGGLLGVDGVVGVVRFRLAEALEAEAQRAAIATEAADAAALAGLRGGDFGGDPGVTASHPTRHTAESMMTMGARALSR